MPDSKLAAAISAAAAALRAEGYNADAALAIATVETREKFAKRKS
jgi:hypothetical protein